MTQAAGAPRRLCSHCGAANPSTDLFCANCGYALDSNTLNTFPVAGTPALRRTGALQSGDRLESRYHIVHLVGKGGFGAVYEARDTRFQSRVVAIKEMSDSRLSPAEKAQAMQDFRREADMLVALDHHNLPDVSDFFEEGNKAYLVMEYIQGETLEKVLEGTNGPLDERRVLNWALQLCDVLQYLHTQPQPIIFRDMKPSNVMVTKQEQIKLIDFGIARIFKSTSVKDTTSLGSRGYAPLEQYGRGQSDARSDIYALGASLYELLTNILPADAPARRINPPLFLPPRQLNPQLSPATEQIILKAMAEEPEDRYQSAAEMQQAILTSGLVTQPQSWQTLSSVPIPATPVPITAQSAGSQVQLTAGPRQPTPISRRTLLTIVVGGAIAVSGVAWAASNLLGSHNSSTGPAVLPATLPLPFVYSTEKDQWFQAAIEAFHKSDAARYQGSRIEIQPQTSGSLDLTSQILSGESKPIAWSPASSLEVNRLNLAWQQHNGQDVVATNELQSLVLSPLVFAVWESRARVLLQKYGHIDWDSIYAALTLKNGWSDIQGSADWQRVSLGQTRPDASNSGLLTITLMAYAYFGKIRGLTVQDIDDAGFFNYLKSFEDAVTTYGRSSGTYLENEVILKGPGAYDITFSYENLVLTSLNEIKQRQSEPLRMFYPHVNIVSDHPFVLLKGPWVKPEAQEAARAFRQFLLAVPQQQLALQYGLRPTSQNVHLSDPGQNNLFLNPAVQPEIHSDYRSVQLPDGTVVNELLKQWNNHYHDAATGNG